MIIFIIVFILVMFIFSLVLGFKENKIVVKWYCNMIGLKYFSLMDINRLVIDSLDYEFLEFGIDKMVKIEL